MAPPPVQLTMQPVPQAPPLPLRWAEAVRGVEAAQAGLDALAKQLEGALYLDEEAWQQAVPHERWAAALQGQQRKIAELEAQLTTVVTQLEASERARAAAEERVRQLGGEVESSASVFRLHYEELLRKDREIQDLQAVISALSLGGGTPGGAAGGGTRDDEGAAGGSNDGGGTPGGSSDGEGS